MEINDEYPGLVVPDIYNKTQLEILAMVEENGIFKPAQAEAETKKAEEAPKTTR